MILWFLLFFCFLLLRKLQQDMPADLCGSKYNAFSNEAMMPMM